MGNAEAFITRNFIKCRGLRCSRHIARLGEGTTNVNILTRKPTVKKPPGRPRHGWKDNVKLRLKEIGLNAD